NRERNSPPVILILVEPWRVPSEAPLPSLSPPRVTERSEGMSVCEPAHRPCCRARSRLEGPRSRGVVPREARSRGKHPLLRVAESLRLGCRVQSTQALLLGSIRAPRVLESG